MPGSAQEHQEHREHIMHFLLMPSIFPSHDVCIMAITTPDNKQDHHLSQFEAILTNALAMVRAVTYAQLLLTNHIPNRLNTATK